MNFILNQNYSDGNTPIRPEEAEHLIPQISTMSELNGYEALNRPDLVGASDAHARYLAGLRALDANQNECEAAARLCALVTDRRTHAGK